MAAPERLRTKAEFGLVKQTGQVFRGRFVLVSVLVNSPDHLRRFGFIVTRKTGNAVIRNRCRRRLKEIIRANEAYMNDSVWTVVIARATLSSARYVDIEKDFISAYNAAMEMRSR
ncbi:MAG: ribonuclease P protein component [Candidatus Latescibacteria bacterium]|nr:ribonuclease P protein component [Candidatus Latescibacterota bacterium]